MRDVLAEGSCELIVSLDSDAYFFMAYHRASITDMLQHASVDEHTYGFAAIEDERATLGRYASWATNRSLFIGTNGASGGGVPYNGFPHEFLNATGDYVCAGVYVLRNTDTARQLLDDWAALVTDENRNQHKWEQMPLNRVIFPRYQEHAVVFPFNTLTSTSGMVRHLWRPLADVRNTLAFRDLRACIPGFPFAS